MGVIVSTGRQLNPARWRASWAGTLVGYMRRGLSPGSDPKDSLWTKKTLSGDMIDVYSNGTRLLTFASSVWTDTSLKSVPSPFRHYERGQAKLGLARKFNGRRTSSRHSYLHMGERISTVFRVRP